MVYLPEDRLLWDFWFAPLAPRERDDDPIHLFHLQAPRDLPDPELRHGMASIGHAVSRDLVTWDPRPTAFAPGSPGAWDDKAIWTGSVLRFNDLFYFFYTALSTTDDGRVQRIGLATSPDLDAWTRHPANPLLCADPRWYETAAENPRGREHCRDPFVVYDPGQAAWIMVYCARARDGAPDGRGVIGAARSTDLITWDAIPPLSEPGEFGQLEVPVLTRLGNRWYAVFCTADHSATRLARTGPAGAWYGTHYLVADALTGPYRLTRDEALVGDARGSYYAGRIAEGMNGEPRFFAFRRLFDDGSFAGGLSNGAPVTIDADGELWVEMTALWE